MTTTTESATTVPSPPLTRRPSATLFAVVGFDGSTTSRAAMDAAIELLRGRNGHLEVVYVAHLPASVGMGAGATGLSAAAVMGMRESFTAIADELNATARAALDDREPRWHFQRRDGSITHELVAAATALRHQYGPDPTIFIIVGASAHRIHHLAGSTGVALARDAGFPLLVVPAA